MPGKDFKPLGNPCGIDLTLDFLGCTHCQSVIEPAKGKFGMTLENPGPQLLVNLHQPVDFQYPGKQKEGLLRDLLRRLRCFQRPGTSLSIAWGFNRRTGRN